jgi:hypothetical protein
MDDWPVAAARRAHEGDRPFRDGPGRSIGPSVQGARGPPLGVLGVLVALRVLSGAHCTRRLLRALGASATPCLRDRRLRDRSLARFAREGKLGQRSSENKPHRAPPRQPTQTTRGASPAALGRLCLLTSPAWRRVPSASAHGARHVPSAERAETAHRIREAPMCMRAWAHARSSKRGCGGRRASSASSRRSAPTWR